MAGRVASTARLGLWTAGLVVVVRVLLATGGPRLSVPLTSLDDLARWADDAPPPDMAIAALRLAALALAGYLLLVTALALVAEVVRLRHLAAAVDRVSPRVVRRLVSGGSGIGLVLGGAAGTLPATPVDLPPLDDPVASAVAADVASATMSRLPPTTATMTRTDPEATAPGPAEATMTRLPDRPAPTRAARVDAVRTATPAPPAASAEAVADLPSAPALPEVDPAAWTVEPGDSLWSIAEEVTRLPDGSSPGERVVARYWQRLVEANRAQLVDPANADLLVPGQHLVVPPP
jgi:hypothetical protein